MTDFCCQLHVHSRYSFYDGLAAVDELVARAAELEQPGIGLTDHGVLYGAQPFYKACAEHGIKGVIGMEAYEAVPHEFDLERDGEIFKVKWADLPPGAQRYHHLTLWAYNRTGWENLCRLHTASFHKDHKPKNQPLLDRAMLERWSDGLIVGLGCVQSKTNVALAQGNEDAAYEIAKWYPEVFPGRTFMELMANTDDQQRLLRPQRKLAKRLGVECISTNDVHYRDRKQGELNGSHHVMVQGRRFKKKEGAEETSDKSDAGFGQWYGSDGFFLKSGAEMLSTGGLQRDEIERTLAVLDMVDFSFGDLPAPRPPVARIPRPGEDPAFDAWRAST